MKIKITNWIKLRFEWYRVWWQVLDLAWISKVGRDRTEISRMASFKAFEAWVSVAQESYDSGELAATINAVGRASAMFDRLDDKNRLLLSNLARSARMEEYRMHVAQLCQ